MFRGLESNQHRAGQGRFSCHWRTPDRDGSSGASDSNHDSELQRLAPLPLDDAGIFEVRDMGVETILPIWRTGAPAATPIPRACRRRGSNPYPTD